MQLLKKINLLCKMVLYKKLRDINLQNDKFRNYSKKYEKVKNIYFRNQIFSYYSKHLALSKEYKDELLLLHKYDNLPIFLYKNLKYLKDIYADFDTTNNMPYVIHNGKKLYFPEKWGIERAINEYKNFIETENIIGGHYKEKSPHQYESDTVSVNEEDVLIDLGCAEALFSLDVIEKVKALYLIESDPIWIAPLKATFEPFKDKVNIINKLVSNFDSDTSITMASLMNKMNASSVFIKMDIEGSETNVISNSIDYLKNLSNIKIACCTYHKYTDADILNKLFTQSGFNTEFSNGYMLILNDIRPPFFRKGLIRAYK